MRFASLAFLSSVVLLVASSPTWAGVPDPGHCTVPVCITTCPAGDMLFTITVRDFASNPVASSQVALDFSACPGPIFCAKCADIYSYDGLTRIVRKTTDATGSVTFALCAGGETCPGSLVAISADGVVLGSVPYASPDQNGDGAINGTDLTQVNARITASSADADFNCSGAADAADLAIFNAHLGHACAVIVPARPATWGTLKIQYR